MKYCKDCNNMSKSSVCTVVYHNPITGEETSLPCIGARSNECYCGAEAKQFEAKKHKRGDYELYLRMYENGDLYVVFDIEKDWRAIGHVTADGFCRLVNTVARQGNWELWTKHGKKVAKDNGVEWKGGTYFIDDFCILTSNTEKTTAIYDFKHCIAMRNCTDANIQRFSNGTPRLF